MAFWKDADLGIEGDDSLDQALHFNLFHVRQSTPSDGRNALAAKGLTGQGYEGHVFWDTEIFALPVLQMTAPSLVRASLDWRSATLDRARAHARELNHPIGALYPWRTIAGDEGRAIFRPDRPSITSTPRSPLRCACIISAATARRSRAKMRRCCSRRRAMWMQVGHHDPARKGAFCIHSVTGPDEYSALVNNDCYTNRMAQMHLRFAADVADDLARASPEGYQSLAQGLDLLDTEPAPGAGADAMYLPVDERHGVHPQDDCFLDRPMWNFANEPGDDRPLLLRFHPLTLYRYQVCKQPSVVLADVLSGRGYLGDAQAPRLRLLRAADRPRLVTVRLHLGDSRRGTGTAGPALDYFREGARLDLDDLHGNASHGAHMAAMAGTWQGLVWGFGGLRIGSDGTLRLRPLLPGRLARISFFAAWRGRLLRVSVTAAAVLYELQRGAALTVMAQRRGRDAAPGKALKLALAPIVPVAARRNIDGVIFDLDGVLTDTAELHFQAWSRLAWRSACHSTARPTSGSKASTGAVRSTSFSRSATRALRRGGAAQALAARKNGYFVALIQTLTPASLLPGALDALRDLRERGVRIALASASHNARHHRAPRHRRCLRLHRRSGESRPAEAWPDIFLDAAAGLGASPARCIGVEDAMAGIARSGRQA
jgi:HAD superfamily hydrolase (TIGR01509 family)